ncbi:MAG: Gfo/Idh/MocA family oxidoreductase [Planctomycetaceae bacterium]
MSHRSSRRTFLKSAAAIGAGLYVGRPALTWASRSPNEKMNVACVGVGGRGFSNVQGVATENIIAMCDVDELRASEAFKAYPQATKYKDFRKLLDAEKLDGVVVATTDHVHVPVAVNALRRGLPVYVEKPLGHNVWETRLVTDLAKEKGLPTQLGTQIHASDNYRRVVEAIQAGAIGPVREVHVWVGKIWGGGERPTAAEPVPSTLDWDLWLGPAPERPHHTTYYPANWRRWWDFGSGTLGDMGCHYMDLVFWALALDAPTRIAAEGPPPHPETAPTGLTVVYDFPAKGDRPAVKMTWSDGDRIPTELHGIKLPGAGVLFVGDEGQMFADYGGFKLSPEEKFADWKAPEKSIPDSIGHHAEWIRACKTGEPTTCHFGYSGPLTETVLLGVVAHRLGQPLEWNAAKLEATNAPEAAKLIRPAYRKGWEIA